MTRELTIAEALNEALHEELEADPTVFTFGEDIASGGLFGVNKGLRDRFGRERCFNTPISEQAIAGLAVGAAMVGARPVAEIQIMDFISLALDQIANHAAKLPYMTGGQIRVPMVVRGPATTGIGLAAQHSQSLEAWVVHVPGLKVVMPSTPADAKGLLKSAIRDPNPVVFFEKRLLYSVRGPVPDGEHLVPLGVADVVREGRDVTLVASGFAAHYGREAVARLAEEGIDVELIDLRTLKPLDLDAIIGSVRKTHRVVVASDGYRTCGFASELAAAVMEAAFDYLDAPVARVASADTPVPCAQNLEAEVLITTDKLVRAVREVVGAAEPSPAGAR
ncbi:MAG TPA: alpha-ketoacid dehydrogenase subunit beta [Chloroflexota bacterium]|jgi:pyruvate dehydrogenase E1 component beta subunit